MVPKTLIWAVVALLAAGISTTEILLGGWWYPALSGPGYFLVACAALAAAALFWRPCEAPGAVCSAVTILFFAYLFWRQSNSPDNYAAREDSWLLLGAFCVYLAVSWQLRSAGQIWLLIGVLLFLSTAQVLLAVSQFAADKPFHPMASVAEQLRLPDGKIAVANLGLITGTLHARTALSGVLEVTTFLALGLAVWGRCPVWTRLLLLWACAAGFVGMVICLSRSAYLALPAGLIVFALASFFVIQRGVYVHRFWLGAGALVMVLLALGMALATGYQSFAVWLRLGVMAVDQYRQDLWSITVPPMLHLDPLFGTGANTFESLARRYRGMGFTADPIHAHSDWLQLLIEYGWIGFALGAAVFLVHFGAGWRNILRITREIPPSGLLPQSMELGLATGALAAFAAIGVHVIFDYSLHLPVVAMLTALCAALLASMRHGPLGIYCRPPFWLKFAGILPALPGFLLAGWVWTDFPAERQLLAAENSLLPLEPENVASAASMGLSSNRKHPQLLWVAGLAARHKASPLAESDPRQCLNLMMESVRFFRAASAERPTDVFFWQELAWASDSAAFAAENVSIITGNPFEKRDLQLEAEKLRADALRAHLRCIGRDPDHARGYENLARHYAMMEKPDEARRLFSLAQRLAGSKRSIAGLETLPKEQKSP